MMKTKTLAVLLATLVFALTLGGYAHAHALLFESDLSEDGAVNVCNPEGVQVTRVATAIEEWNTVTERWGRPTLRNVTGSGAFCEVEVERQGGDQAGYYARVVFARHPDGLQISQRFADLSDGRKQGTITHEFGHVLGLSHPNGALLCEESIMTTIRECREADARRRNYPGPHDEADLLDYWVEEPTYPVANKCWTNTDEDGDGKCDMFGPPDADTFNSQDSADANDRNHSGESPNNAVRAPEAVED